MDTRALIREPECSVGVPLLKKDFDLLLDELLMDQQLVKVVEVTLDLETDLLDDVLFYVNSD